MLDSNPIQRGLLVLCLVTGSLAAQVPDPNLVPNPGFELGGPTTFTDWSYYQNNGSGSAGVSTSPQPVYAGTRAAILNVSLPGDLGLYTPEPGIIPVVPNTSYTISGWARSANAGGTTCLHVIEWHTGSSNATSDDWPNGGCASSTAWTAVQGTFTTQSTTNAVSIRLMGHIAAGTYYWDEIRLVRTDTQPIYVTAAPIGCAAHPPTCLTYDTQIQIDGNNHINLSAELDRWAAIYQDVKGGGACAAGATQALTTRLTNALAVAPFYDNRNPSPVTYFHQFLAGAIVTHIYAAAKEIDYHSVPNSLAPLLAQVKTKYGGDPNLNYTDQIPTPQDPGCGIGSITSFVNSCMDDHTLTASGYAWLAAFEYQRLRSPEPFRTRAFNEINYSLAPMSANQDATTHGGGPCVEPVTPNLAHCSGTVANYTASGYRLIGADHGQENPNYGLGLVTGLASACAAIYDAGSTCGTFSGWNATAATELLHTAQQRASRGPGLPPYGADWDQDGCPLIPGSTYAPCDDHVYLQLSANDSYKPYDFPITQFYSRRGISVAGYPADTAFQFDFGCGDPRTVWNPPYSTLWGPNRYTFYWTLSNELYGADTQAPRVVVSFPTTGQVLTGPTTLAVDTADNNRVNHVSYYVDGGTTPFYTANWPFIDPLDTSTGYLDGTYNVMAKAFDDVNNAGASGTIPMRVSNPRVNAGGSGFVDQYGNHWFTDYDYNTGYTASTTASISNTDLPQLYQSVRWYPGVFTYTLPVANGTRTVKLRFAEFVYTTPGARYFNVLINGSQVLTNFDVVAAAGGAFIAVDRSFVTTVTNQQVTVTFVPVHENPEINAIEVH
jgi:hypothetical protein